MHLELWAVERALRSETTELEWILMTYGTENVCRETARQCGPAWRRDGYTVRVRRSRGPDDRG